MPCPSQKKISLMWLAWFCVCLYPVTISGIGVNYLFVLTPLFYVLAGGRLHLFPAYVSLLACLSIAIFSLAFIYQYEYYGEGFRRIASFILFASVFSLAVINLKSHEFDSILIAIILVSCWISIVSIYQLLNLGLVESAFEAKDEVGSQRYGFLLVFSFWAVLWYVNGRGFLFKIGMYSLAGLLVIGVMLTFSRASFVSFAGSAVLYMMMHRGRFGLARLGGSINIIYAIILGAGFLLVLNFILPSIYQFFEERLFNLFVSGRIFDNISNPETSEGTRFRIWTDIIDFVIRNPLTGSGFLGAWVMMEDTGSAHNQYMDVLLRLGFIGFFVYIVLLWQIWKLLKNRSALLLSGFFGVLIYGMFHETFKEPSGALLLAFIFSYYSTNVRRQEIAGPIGRPELLKQ